MVELLFRSEMKIRRDEFALDSVVEVFTTSGVSFGISKVTVIFYLKYDSSFSCHVSGSDGNGPMGFASWFNLSRLARYLKGVRGKCFPFSLFVSFVPNIPQAFAPFPR
ncbi:MFS transporter [Sesbania bispinosa]|nr:MFS transporter [Sesbania bispinosa]